MSPQDPKYVVEMPQGVSAIPLTALRSQLLTWAGSKGAITSVAELNDPENILLRLDQGQLPQQPLWAPGWRDRNSSAHSSDGDTEPQEERDLPRATESKPVLHWDSYYLFSNMSANHGKLLLVPIIYCAPTMCQVLC